MAADLGLYGGIAEGINQGISSYQQASANAQEMALKRRAAKLQEIDTAGKIIGETGFLPKGLVSPEVEQMYNNPQQPQGAQQLQQQPQSQQDQASATPPGQGEAKMSMGGQAQSSSGLMGKPSSPSGLLGAGQISPEQQDAVNRGYTGSKISPASRVGRQLVSQAQQMSMTGRDKGMAAYADLDTGQVRLVKAPYSEKETLALAEGKAKLKNSELEPTEKLVHDFTEQTKNFDDSASNFQKGHSMYNANSSVGDKGLAYSFIRMENPNAVIREGSLEDIRNLPGAAKYEAILSQMENGRLPQRARDDIMRAMTALYQGQREQHLSAIEDYKSRADEYGIKIPQLDKKNYKKLDALAAGYADKLKGGYQQPDVTGGLMGKLKGFLGGGQQPQESMAASSAGQMSGHGVVRVQKGNEVLLIQPSDLQHALKDGYQQVQ